MAAATAATAGLASGSPSDARNPTTPKAMNATAAISYRRRATMPSNGPEDQRDGDDEQLEGELVVRAEQADDEVLGAGRLEIDHHLTDGRDERRRAGQDARQQLGDAECRRGRHQPGDRRGPVATMGCRRGTDGRT